MPLQSRLAWTGEHTALAARVQAATIPADPKLMFKREGAPTSSRVHVGRLEDAGAEVYDRFPSSSRSPASCSAFIVLIGTSPTPPDPPPMETSRA